MLLQEIYRKATGNDPYVKLAEEVLVYLNEKIDGLLPKENRGTCKIAIKDKDGSIKVNNDNLSLRDRIVESLKEFKKHSKDHEKVPPIDDVDREFDDDIKIGKLSESERESCALGIANGLFSLLKNNEKCSKLWEFRNKVFNEECIPGTFVNDTSAENREKLSEYASLFVSKLSCFNNKEGVINEVKKSMSSTVAEINKSIKRDRYDKFQRAQQTKYQTEIEPQQERMQKYLKRQEEIDLQM